MASSRVLSRLPNAITRRHHIAAQLLNRQRSTASTSSPSLTSTAVGFGSFPKVHYISNFKSSILRKHTLHHFGFSSSSSSKHAEKGENEVPADKGDTSQSATDENADPKCGEANASSTASEQMEDSEEENDLSIDDLIKLVDEKEELLKLKHKEIEKMQDKVLRSYAEMENVLDRTKREAENSKKFAIQNFAKSLLDVADNLDRASSVVKKSFAELDQSKDSAGGALPLLKTLLEGVEMTDKQLAEVFRKFGIEKFDPTNEHFDPHRHHAVFQIPDASKPVGTVAAVLKPGYVLYERVIRPAEVGVTESVGDDAAE